MVYELVPCVHCLIVCSHVDFADVHVVISVFLEFVDECFALMRVDVVVAIFANEQQVVSPNGAFVVDVFHVVEQFVDIFFHFGFDDKLNAADRDVHNGQFNC